MKLDFIENGGGIAEIRSEAAPWQVHGETQRLRDVLLCAPAYLEPVPCCSVTRETVRDGVAVCRDAARAQHAQLRLALEGQGVTCHVAPVVAGMPDLCFTRDVAVTTPWGLVALNPALPHRRREVDHVVAAVGRIGARPMMRVTAGTIEGGDICIARPGLLIIGCSGERTTREGAEAFAALFRRHGWEVLVYAYDPHFLHLDTIFCMLDPHRALACVDVLDEGFLAELAARGIELIPVSYKEARRLGCNVLSIDGRTILTGKGQSRVTAELARAGFTPIELDISQLTACGGGIHCLTMPLARSPER
jgi:N-dimethylarginine dimethylaminohydrolase